MSASEVPPAERAGEPAPPLEPPPSAEQPQAAEQPQEAEPEREREEQQAVEELELRQVERLARIWGVEPVAARQDLPDPQVVHDESLREWLLNGADDSLCIMEDGTIVTSQPDSSFVEAASNLLTLRNRRPTVRPALSSVVRAARNTIEGEGLLADAGVDDRDQSQTEVHLLFMSILEAALERNASDIHFEMRGPTCDVRFRVNGRMTRYDQISAGETLALGNYMFNAEAKRGSLQFITHMPLYGSMDANVRGQTVAVRLSTAPDIRGVDIFLRIWRPETGAISLGELGYTPLQIEMLQEGIRQPYGVVVMSGPTGSGKSTTVTAMLETVDPEFKIVSLEEPVERMLANVTHVAVSSVVETGDWVSLRAGLNRWDSNINVLGEIKDRETADAIKDLATSGKLTVTTLHASNVLSIPARMEDLGVDHAMLYDPNFLVMLINQRLLHELCQECRMPMSEGESLSRTERMRFNRLFAEYAERVFVRGPGCGNCRQTGIVGRLLAAEIVMVDDPSRGFIRERDPIGWRTSLREKGWRPIADHALIHVREGRVDPRSVERMVGRLDMADSRVYDYAAQERLDAESRE